ncbi:uncharacterized protein LOC111778743 [Cucurbita pepo subsp. pepo]|uniref:uncharacterized protein LOC111778743 n=1 Tax=Cucurbita pepo subsp. pepo TaxID=3664 RepID=UPI000C9DA088|nr:uncharacterized protein LOC111778743 [Cucurbita pepo subsp. pepo]
MTSMFLVRVKNFRPLVDGTSRLAQIGRESDIIFTPLSLMLTTSGPSPRFIAMLQIFHQCFTVYSVNIDHRSRISLESLHDALLDCGSSSSMTIHLLENTNLMVLRFETPNHEPQLRHDVVLLPPQEQSIEEIEYSKSLALDSRDLRQVIKELPLFSGDSVCVTVTSSRVRFSIASRELIFKKEKGRCEILGHDGDAVTEFRIVLYPMLFFLNLTYDVQTVLGLGLLRNSISSLLTLSNSAEFKCSPQSMSLTVSYTHKFYNFISVLRIFDRFFTIFSFGPNTDIDADYAFEIQLSDFFRHIPDEDSHLVVLIPKSCTSLNVLSATRYGNFRSLASLVATPSENEEVGQFDLKLFVAIEAEKFRKIVTTLAEDGDPLLGTASTSSVRFCARRRRTGKSSELVVSAKRRECLAGGFNDRVDEIRFSFTPTPKEFFVGASESAKFVWFFGSTDWPTTVICFTTQWTNLLACYPISASSFLLHSFALKKIS